MSTVEWISLITKSFIKNINHENYFITHVISNSMVLLNLLVHKISILKKEELTALLRNRPHDESI